jgi:hypothetical protein
MYRVGRAPGAAIVSSLVTALGVGCGGTSGAMPDGASDAGGPTDADARFDAAYACMDATVSGDVSPSFPSAGLTCGGEVAVAGSSPFGVFAPKNVRAEVGYQDCQGLRIYLETGSITDAGDDRGQSLTIVIPYDGSLAVSAGATVTPQSGTLHLMGFLTSGASQGYEIPVTLEVTSADPIAAPDGGTSQSAVGPPGQITARIDADSGCGHIVGSFTAPYCGWMSCV